MIRTLISAIGLSLFASSALAHSWYENKSDPSTLESCCGGYDCEKINAIEVQKTSEGYLFIPTGEIIPWARVQKSEDDDYHRCWVGNRAGKTRCFFVPKGLNLW